MLIHQEIVPKTFCDTFSSEEKVKTLSNFLSGKPCKFSLGLTNFLCGAHLTFVHITFLQIIQSQDKIYPAGDLKFGSARVIETIHYQLASILTIFSYDPFSTEQGTSLSSVVAIPPHPHDRL